MSSITQLSVLNKDTDAYATEAGYEYQKLKTLESWLQNAVDKSDEVIYYDYEEDIFQRDLTELKSTFRQIKLYSSNFSFASVEIRKTISHFFTLFCLGDYLLDDITFVFEANSNIARSYGNNEAQLLKDWHDNQEDLEEPLLSKCVAICKQIVSEFIDSQDDSQPQIANAKSKFEQLKSENDFWIEFVKSIRWKFEGVEREEALTKSLKQIEKLARQLPFPINGENIDSVVHSLHFHISQCATKENPEERLLDSSLLESKILESIGGTEKWYGEQLDRWNGLDKIEEFRLGQLYELISISRFYRQHHDLDGHREIWARRLMEYLALTDIPDYSRKDILYELVFLKLRPTLEYKYHAPDTAGIEDLVNQYFEIVPSKFSDPLTIAETVNFFSVVRVAGAIDDLVDIETEKYEAWLEEIENTIVASLEKAQVNTRCEYLESLSVIEFNLKNWGEDDRAQRFENGINLLKDIIDLSDKAEQYNYSNLLIRINEYIKVCFMIGLADEHPEFISKLEAISTDLAVIVSKREGDHSLAVQFRERGVNYLKLSKNPKDLLRALDYFHKSKNLLFKNETKDGLALIMLNICQVYLAIGYNYAAKYYALAAFYYSMQDEELFKRAVKSVAFVFRIDYESGSWMHCILDFERFIVFTGELDPDWDIQSNVTLGKVLVEYSSILFTAPKLVPELDELIQQRIDGSGWIKEDYLDMFIDGFSNSLPSEEELIKLTKSKLRDYPLNDIGEERIIQFRSFNALWKVKFPNTYEFNSIGEEFCAICQILFADMKTFYPEFDLNGDVQTVELNLIVVDNPTPPNLISMSSADYVWELYLPEIPKPLPYNPLVIGSLLSVLRGLNVRSDEYFSAMRDDLMINKKLGSKVTIIKPYDELYTSLYSESEFTKLESKKFSPLEVDKDFVRKNITDN